VADIFVENNPAGGAPHWPIVTMLKIVFLQKCFGLSDPMVEEMLLDRISFRQFVGLSLDDKTPDFTVLSKFRTRLREHGHGSTLFDKTLRILQERGVVLKNGTIIDATIIEAPLGGQRADGSDRGDPAATTTVKGGGPTPVIAPTSPPIGVGSSPTMSLTPPASASMNTSTPWPRKRPGRSSPIAGVAVKRGWPSCGSVALCPPFAIGGCGDRKI
jgi:IS5 family transposase